MLTFTIYFVSWQGCYCERLMTPNSGAGAGEEKAVSWRHFILIIMCADCAVTMIIFESQVNFTIMYRRENMRQYELRADTVHETNSWIDAIKMAR